MDAVVASDPQIFGGDQENQDIQKLCVQFFLIQMTLGIQLALNSSQRPGKWRWPCPSGTGA